ncbi:hypothetical protein [Niveibacterium sp. COAC-50]|uniref:hypothetical protein n=1 Tax=Niveibacterium sp. COAC-50 TaxID=2729384 RepID=UPI001555CE5E|nr:hypothetical protein [Niveibacterium sp. COAC-50]
MNARSPDDALKALLRAPLQEALLQRANTLRSNRTIFSTARRKFTRDKTSMQMHGNAQRSGDAPRDMSVARRASITAMRRY